MFYELAGPHLPTQGYIEYPPGIHTRNGAVLKHEWRDLKKMWLRGKDVICE